MEWIGDLERAFAAAIYPNRVAIAVAGTIALVVIAWVARRRGWARSLRAHRRATLISVAALLVIGGPLTWYLASPLFISSQLDEPAPVVIGNAATPAPSQAASSADPSFAAPVPGQSSTTGGTGPLAERRGAFIGADEFHFGRGTARLIETAPGTWVVRLEDFEVRNGPDLFVYLSTSPDGYAEGAVEIGRLKADRGSQNYEVPAGADLAAFRSVVIWCRAFAVQFASAPLS